MDVRPGGSDLIWFLLTLVIWSSMEAVSKPLMGWFDPFSLTFCRFLCGIAVLAVVAALQGRLKEFRSLDRRTLLMLCSMGLLNTFLSMSLLQLAVLHSTPATAATVFCVHPVLVLAGSVILGWERFSWIRSAAFAAAFAGVALVSSAAPGGGLAGPAFALAAALAFASYTLMSKKVSGRVSPVTANLVSFCAGVVALGVFMAATGRDPVPGNPAGAGTADLLRFIHLGVLVSGIGYLTFFRALKAMPVSAASLIFFLKPVLATGFSAALTGERPSAAFFAGLALVVLSTAACLLSRPRPRSGPCPGPRLG
ncbi:MAG TPA: DMT family transporter [Candidatus Fermentibacter daniensis]|jgi:drug/metabolite transporter (DMT)-like permease|nr:MAG: hypothetical protein AO396_04320 [Candidatus Fermentibacter daniensis]MBP7719935.1 DMT family transporter [Candidatus Fermentibacter sp.]KZD18032.1 MAG: hypothetical protein AO395_01175 [Candidatus Fermentibacter daniensis]MCC6870929.1 DMT family transporter [Candidatus Fermentibacter sp.]NLI02311.1 DMT family transporter [Candidatus Fermentibacter daniensis]